MFVLKIVLLVFSLFTFSDAKFEDTLKKCSINDEKCLKSLFQNIVNDAGKDGIPDLGIPPLNSLKVSNVSVNIFDTVKGTFIDGVLEGIGSCIYNKFQIDVEKRITTQDVVCDIKMQGSVELSGKNPMMQAVLGTSSVDAYGKGGVKLDKLNFKFETPFHLYKKDDGKIYLRLDDKDVNYLYNIKDASIWSDKMTIGNQEISTKGVDYLNKHMKVIVENFGSIFIDQGAAIYCDLANQFYGALPMNNYIIEDLTPYVQN